MLNLENRSKKRTKVSLAKDSYVQARRKQWMDSIDGPMGNGHITERIVSHPVSVANIQGHTAVIVSSSSAYYPAANS